MNIFTCSSVTLTTFAWILALGTEVRIQRVNPQYPPTRHKHKMSVANTPFTKPFFTDFFHPDAIAFTNSSSCISCSVEATDGKKVLTNAMVVEDSGKLYLLEKRGVIATQTGDGENWAATYTLPKIQKTEDGESIHIKEIYYGTENDNILIWSE